MSDQPSFPGVQLLGGGNYGIPSLTNISQPGMQLPGGLSLDQALDIGGDIWDWATGGGGDESSNGTAQAAPQGGVMNGCAIYTPITTSARHSCAPGYVVVTGPNGAKTCMLKEAARACGKWKPARKPPMSASDWRCLMKAARVQGKVDRLVKAANKVSGKARLVRKSRSSR